MSDDEATRARLRALAQAEPLPELDALAHTRAERAAHERLRAMRIKRARLGLALAAAACLLVLVGGAWLWRAPQPAVLAWPRGSQPSQLPAASTPNTGFDRWAPEPLAHSGACSELSASAWETLENETPALQLGDRARLVATRGARVTSTISAACDVDAELSDGRLAVHAARLRGRALRVRTPFGEVAVKGTIFEVSVSPRDGELRVSVDEGLVQVSGAGWGRAEVAPGRTLIVRETPTSAAFGPAQRQGLRRLLGLRARAAIDDAGTQGDPGAAEPTALPEDTRYWHTGSVPAPHLPPSPGSSVTPDGRPMSKPHVTQEGADP